jgi:serine/threonine protein kinase/regulation of enolase protein 1 (concanavalin A-like superfamily)
LPGASRAESGRFDFLDPPRAPDELGWLAHYRVRRLVGEGGMGLVFEAEDADLLRTVALKVIRPELAGSPLAAQRFLLEARAMAALKHDHIVTIYQVGQERGVPFLAMEYLQGMSLHRWLERGHKPAVDLLLRLGREMAAGLAAAHRRGVVHRDIKPANIWLEAPIGRVKILDFGLARAEGHDVHITNPGTTVGSPAYMAPELARGERGDAASDLFSLGCVLYLLCTRRLPFPGTTIVAVLTALATDTPPPPRETNPAIPPALDELVMRLLAKRPADRPATAQAVVEAIRSIEQELQVQRQRAELSPEPPPVAVADPATPAADGVGGEPGAPGDPSQTRRRRALGIAAAAVLLGIVAIPTTITLRPHGAGSLVPDRRGPEVVAVPDPSRAVPQPRPSPIPAVAIAPPSPAKPAAEVKPARDEGARMVAPGVDPPRPEGVLKPAVKEAATRIERLWDRERILDPDADCRVLLDKANDRASILVPGVAHLLSAEIDRMNAPRIVREVAGDFEVRVRVTGVDGPGSRATTTRYAPFHGAGILLSVDADDYVRLEIAADHRKSGTFSYANLEHRQDGHLVTSWGLKIEDGSTYLRLRRLGDQLRAAFSPDGEHWTSFAPLIAKLPDRVEIGVAAINSATKPLEAHLEGFQLRVGPGAGSETDADRTRSKPTAPPVETGRDP